MPIRINLLAEAHAAEEERRKDPVKRAGYVAALIVLCVVLWAVMLQFKVGAAKSELGRLEARWKAIEKNYQGAVNAQKASLDVDQRLGALHQMTTNRFLWGNVLNAFQQTLANIEGVQVVKLKTEQTYLIGEGTAARTNGATVIPGKPPTSTERVSMTIEAMDVSAQPGRRVNQFRESIAAVPFFKEVLNKTNGVMLLSRSAPQNSANGTHSFVMFSLKATFPEKTR
jgi:hypothetical protein